MIIIVQWTHLCEMRKIEGEKLRERVKHLWKQPLEHSKILSSLTSMKTMMITTMTMKTTWQRWQLWLNEDNGNNNNEDSDDEDNDDNRLQQWVQVISGRTVGTVRKGCALGYYRFKYIEKIFPDLFYSSIFFAASTPLVTVGRKWDEMIQMFFVWFCH